MYQVVSSLVDSYFPRNSSQNSELVKELRGEEEEEEEMELEKKTFVDEEKSSDTFFNIKFYQKQLSTNMLGRYFIYRLETSSTMDDIKYEIKNGGITGTVVLAESQTQGRGQNRGDDRKKTRIWSSLRKGNLYFSFLMRVSVVNLSKVILSLPVCICKALEVVGIKDPKIKWPNDVLVSGKKISGILVLSDTELGSNSGVNMNIGIGINVFEDMSKNKIVESIATSCYNILENRSFSREQILATFFNFMEYCLKTNDENYILKEYKKYSFFKVGQDITIMPKKKEVEKEYYEATFLGVDRKGYLIVKKKCDGSEKKLMNGEVSIKLK